ncbi:MAG: hypothetical protein AAF750_00235 [Planctomycetota bacterium]
MALTTAVWPNTSAGEVVYRETFPRAANADGPDDARLLGDGWNLNWQSKAMSGDRAAFNSNHANGGSPQDLPAINASAESNAPTRDGYVLHGYDWTGPHLFWTQEFEIDRTQWDVTGFAWRQADNDRDAETREPTAKPSEFRVAVRVGTDWYVSSQAFATDGPFGVYNMNASAQAMSLAVASASWLPLEFVPTRALAFDTSATSVDLPVGIVTAFGLYIDKRTRHIAFDTFEVTASRR